MSNHDIKFHNCHHRQLPRRHSHFFMLPMSRAQLKSNPNQQNELPNQPLPVFEVFFKNQGWLKHTCICQLEKETSKSSCCHQHVNAEFAQSLWHDDLINDFAARKCRSTFLCRSSWNCPLVLWNHVYCLYRKSVVFFLSCVTDRTVAITDHHILAGLFWSVIHSLIVCNTEDKNVFLVVGNLV